MTDETNVERNIEMRLQFTGRTFGVRQELPEFLIPTALKSLGNVRWYRDGGAADLITESEVSGEFSHRRQLVNLASERPSLLGPSGLSVGTPNILGEGLAAGVGCMVSCRPERR